MREQQISDLLALRDGELSDADARRVAERPGSLGVLGDMQRLRDTLRALPDPVPDDALWARIRTAAKPPVPEPRRGAAVVRFPGGLVPYAAAAGLVLALGAALLGVNAVRQNAAADDLIEVAAAAAGDGEDPMLRRLHERSKRLEPLLLTADRRDPTEQALRLRIADLDGQIVGGPDGRLNRQTEQQLWGQRVALLESLAEVRRARATVQPAVY